MSKEECKLKEKLNLRVFREPFKVTAVKKDSKSYSNSVTSAQFQHYTEGFQAELTSWKFLELKNEQ
jgi:hypothetical protein